MSSAHATTNITTEAIAAAARFAPGMVTPQEYPNSATKSLIGSQFA